MAHQRQALSHAKSASTHRVQVRPCRASSHDSQAPRTGPQWGKHRGLLNRAIVHQGASLNLRPDCGQDALVSDQSDALGVLGQPRSRGSLCLVALCLAPSLFFPAPPKSNLKLQALRRHRTQLSASVLDSHKLEGPISRAVCELLKTS